jgi:histone H3/H4
MARLGRRAGIKSLNSQCYEEIRGVMKVDLENILRAAMTFQENDRKKTLNSTHVLNAIKTIDGVNFVCSNNIKTKTCGQKTK